MSDPVAAPAPDSPPSAPERSSESAPRAITRLVHRVAFYQTDAMGIMHHANYLHLLENARVRWIEEHDEPYRTYVEAGLHFAVTRVEVRYRRGARFDDAIAVDVWLEGVGGASLRMAYRLTCGETLLAEARTEHALVDTAGRPARIPAHKRARLAELVVPADSPAPGPDPERRPR